MTGFAAPPPARPVKAIWRCAAWRAQSVTHIQPCTLESHHVGAQAHGNASVISRVQHKVFATAVHEVALQAFQKARRHRERWRRVAIHRADKERRLSGTRHRCLQARRNWQPAAKCGAPRKSPFSRDLERSLSPQQVMELYCLLLLDAGGSNRLRARGA